MTMISLYIPLVLELGVVLSHDVTSDMSLEEAHDSGETLFTKILKMTKYTSPEEHLGVSALKAVLLKLESIKYILSHNLAINKALGDGVGSQDGVSVEK